MNILLATRKASHLVIAAFAPCAFALIPPAYAVPARPIETAYAITTEELSAFKAQVEKATELEKQGKYDSAIAIWEQLVPLAEKFIGPNHPDVGIVLSELGGLYALKLNYSKAEPLYQRALVISEKALGPEHPNTANSLINLALLYYNQGLHNKAELLFQRSVAISENVPGADYVNTTNGLNGLGLVYYSQRLYSKAEPLYQRVIAIREKVLGSDHPDTATSLHNLGDLYDKQGVYSKAEPLYERALVIRMKAFGSDHPDAVTSLINLARIYEAQGLYSKAEPLYQRALGIREKALGPDHPSTAESLNNLAGLYDSQGLYIKAEPLYQRALEIREKALGPDHPSTAASLNNLAGLYATQGLYSKAEPLYQRALEIREKALGPDHPSTAVSLNNLAGLYDSQGLYIKAEPLYESALAIKEKSLGPDHPSTATIINNLAVLYARQGLHSKAEPLYQRVIAIREKVLGLDHPDTATILNNLAFLYYNQGLHNKAEPLYQRALVIREKALGPDHPSTAESLNNLAKLFNSQGSHGIAEPLYARVLAIFEKALGPDHPSTATSLNNLAGLYYIQGLYSKAEPLYARALTIREKALGPDHPDTGTSLNDLAGLYYSQGLYSKAEPLARRGLVIENMLVQREAPLMTRSDRQAFVLSFGYVYRYVFSLIGRSNGGANLALFSRLNRQGLLEEVEKRQALSSSLPGAQQQLAQQLRELTQQQSSLLITSDQRKFLKARQEELERQLYRLLPELKPRIVEIEQVAAALPAGSALVEYQRYRPFDGKKKPKDRWGEARYLALVLKPDRSITAVDLGPAAPIEERIQKALEASQQAWSDSTNLWAQVGDQILDPLADALSGVQTLFISPDGELNRIPFAALPAPGRTALLTEALQLRLLTTGRELLDLVQPTSKGKTAPLVVANPAYEQLASEAGNRRVLITAAASASAFSDSSQQRSSDLQSMRWAPLPGTAKEGQAIATLTKARLLSGEQATAAAVQGTPAPLLLHIASHAFYLADQAKQPDKTPGISATGSAGLQGESPLLRSGIALAGANQASKASTTSDTADDGYLTALEITQLDWKGTELVVISACESGKGDIQAGEGVYGLKRAIAVAGARSSLLSLWKVNDFATAAFMESFYIKLKAGISKADALATTQQEFRNHKIAGWRDPYVWAAFQLSGDWRPMRW